MIGPPQIPVGVKICETIPKSAEIHQIYTKSGQICQDLVGSQRDQAESRRDLAESRRDFAKSRRDLAKSQRDLVESRSYQA